MQIPGEVNGRPKRELQRTDHEKPGSRRLGGLPEEQDAPRDEHETGEEIVQIVDDVVVAREPGVLVRQGGQLRRQQRVARRHTPPSMPPGRAVREFFVSVMAGTGGAPLAGSAPR